MPLAAGTKLGPYEITAPIGKGGMGEVYRARDTKLGRDVAIKVLPEELAEDEERVARFEREAKLLASLNHPNIASIYGLEETDGPTALVLELVEGPTLAERIEEGPIPVDEALHIARQMADALESGHEAGVVHRDLKPANVKLKEDGTVKVLDYGLAKALEGDATGGGDSELSQSPTLTRQGTQMGVILGTAAYMSPEQAKGKRVDERTDVWAFGAVVYEMLTGTRAFAGEDVSDTLAAVLRAEPDLDALPPETPAALRRTLQLCLTKDVKKRVRDIGDVRLALEGAFETEVVAADVPRGRRVWLVAALAALAGLTGGLAIRSASAPKATHTPMRLNLSVPPGLLSIDRAVAISRDGRRVAYATRDRISDPGSGETGRPARPRYGGRSAPFLLAGRGTARLLRQGEDLQSLVERRSARGGGRPESWGRPGRSVVGRRRRHRLRQLVGFAACFAERGRAGEPRTDGRLELVPVRPASTSRRKRRALPAIGRD